MMINFGPRSLTQRPFVCSITCIQRVPDHLVHAGSRERDEGFSGCPVWRAPHSGAEEPSSEDLRKLFFRNLMNRSISERETACRILIGIPHVTPTRTAQIASLCQYMGKYSHPHYGS